MILIVQLWEMACSRNLGLTDLPIVCINVDGFYEPFRSILERAHNDQLLHKPHHSEIVEIVHFEPSAERAVAWAEEEVARRRRAKEKDGGAGPKRRNPKQVLRKESVMGGSFFFSGSPLGWVRSASWLGGPRDSVEETNSTQASGAQHGATRQILICPALRDQRSCCTLIFDSLFIKLTTDILKLVPAT
mmetsp:Transcript_61924/g.182933  ORF Transcript_61924/g.182933 Transcript_61924/m.182933 type:complete len:189 (-) Transcript_61924:12-578(-)